MIIWNRKPIPKKTLLSLYINKKFSLSECASKLKVSLHKIKYWLNKYNIPIRSRSDAVYRWHNPDGDPFKFKENLTREEMKLKYLSLGLYWGEGSKTHKGSLRLGNTDPEVIKTFQTFLTNICQLQKHRISYHLQIFKNCDKKIALNYWANELKINPDTIRCGTPIPSQGKGTYKKVNIYGVLTICAFNSHLRENLFDELYKLGLKADSC